MAVTVRHSVIAAAGTLCSRLLGFVRDAAIAWLLGSTTTADAVATALRVPYAVRRLYGEGALSLELTSLLVRARFRNPGSDSALAGNILWLVALIGLGLFLICLVFVRPIMRMLVPGLAVRPEVLEEAVHFFTICAGYSSVVLLAAVCMAFLHARERFGIPALTGSVFNLSVLGCIAAAALGLGNAGTMVALGVLAGGILQFLVQVPFVAKEAGKGWLKSGHADSWSLIRRLPLGLVGAAVPQLVFLVAAGVDSFVPGASLAALFYAERLLEFPLGLIGSAVGMIMATRISMVAAASSITPAHDRVSTPLQNEVRQALELSWLASLPAAAGLIAVAEPLIRLLFAHGAFDDEAVRMTTLCVVAYAPGLPAYALSRPLLASCHAMDKRFPLIWALVAGLGVSLCGGFALISFAGLMAPPFGASLGLWAYVAVLWLNVRCWTGPLALSYGRVFLGIIGSGLVYSAASLLVGWAESPAKALGLAVPCGMIIYGVCMVKDKEIRAMLRHKMGREHE